MKNKSVKYRTPQRLKLFIKDNLATNENILVQIFTPSNKKEILPQIKKTINSNLTNCKIVGLSTPNILLNKSLTEDIVINFITLSSGDFNISYHKNSYSLVKSIKSKNLCFVYATDIDKQSFIDDLDENKNIIGSFFHDFIIVDDEIKDSGALLVEFDAEFEFSIKISEYIKPIGRELEITKSKKNRLYKVDKYDVKTFYEHYLSTSIDEIKTLSYTFALVLKKDGHERNSIIQEIEPTFATFDTKVELYDSVRLGFAKSSKFYSIYYDMIDSFENNYSDLFFIVSSVARSELFKKEGIEFDSAFGIFTTSELAVVNGKVYDQNLSIIALNINKTSTNKLKLKRYKRVSINQDLKELDALSNIAKISSNELEILNKELKQKVALEVEKNLKKDSILIHRSRLAQMGEMISLIAHQWKQPLSAISATSSGLQIKAELDKYDKEFFVSSLNKIENFVKHLSATIDDFSNFFKPSKQKKEAYLYNTIAKALNIATYSLSKNDIVILQNVDKSIKIKTYENELIQVLLNLLKNAENILIKREIKNPKITINAFRDKDETVIEVIDNGGGVDKKIAKKIFEPYFSTKATKDSTGLGLYMSRFIVKNSLGGELKLKNEKDGANFSIHLV